MLAVIYLALAICVGERLCGRFYRFVSLAHRWTAGALVGMLLSACFTYLVARHFASSSNPLLWGDLLFFVTAAIVLLKCPPRRELVTVNPAVARSAKWDWIVLCLFGALASWMMFATLDFKGGQLLIGINQWSDYGPNTAIVQNFAFGHNYPAEYPHFAGEPIRYHFLFYFLAGNLEFLGLSLPWSLNLLSILGIVCLLAQVMALGELLFKSRAVGCLASALFFFHGSLNLIPFFRAQTSIKGALLAIYHLGAYLSSGYPYRGEDWGIWSQVVFVNQRHLASSIGIFLVVLFFLFDRYLEYAKQRKLERALAAGHIGPNQVQAVPEPSIATDLTGRPEVSDQAADTTSAADIGRSDDLQLGEQLSPAPEDSSVSEAAPSDKDDSLTEAPTFVSRAYEEYMSRGSDTGLVSEEKESEVIEPVNQPPPEPDIAAVSEAQSLEASRAEEALPAPILEPAPTVSRGLFAQLVHDNLTAGRAFLFSGLLLGALPYWNAPVFTAAAVVLAFLFVLFPCRRYMLGLALTAGVVGLPQVLALRSGHARVGASLIHWGYTLGNVPISQVGKYIGFTFGIKWVLILLALLFFSWRNLRLFIAICGLFVLTFCFQFSEEALANHKFLNIWLVLANLFVAYGVWRLWHLRIKGWAIPSRLVAILLLSPIIIGGIIDFFPIHNTGFVYTNYTNDRLIGWIRAETKPDAIFMTDKFVNHPILLAGRRIFYGYTYFTWGAGYDLPKREAAYAKMFESKNAQQVFTLLKANGIDYVVFDGGIRSGFKNSNEQEVYAPNFKKVFEGADYWQIAIYKVPENADFVPAFPGTVAGAPTAPAISAFEGGKGKENGQFDFPRGLAVDNAGNILVADTSNGRIQKFSPAGIFVSVIGGQGQGPGQFREPCGMAVDSSGNIYVADVANGRIQKLKPDGTFLAEWKGPEPGFYGPRDIAIGPDNSLYVIDQGHSRIVKFDSNGKVLAIWGAPGKDDGQLHDPTSVVVDGKNERVYVADPLNKRIEVFDVNGKFIAKWPVAEWEAPSGGWYLQDLAIDSKSGLLYVSNGGEVLVFDLTGKKVASLRPTPPNTLDGAASIALLKNSLYVVNAFSARVTRIELPAK
jgi:DNA-binding beta-propeller fold protein YncE